MELLYTILSLSLFLQMIAFILLSIPSTTTGLKARILKAIGTSSKTRLFIMIQIIFLILAAILYLDNQRMVQKWTAQKNFLTQNKNPGTQIRKAELSYKSLLVQRNIYICALTIIVTISLNAYIALFRNIYKKRQLFEQSKLNTSENTSNDTSKAPQQRAKID